MIRYAEDAIKYLIELKLPIEAVQHIRKIVSNRLPAKAFCKNLVVECGGTEDEWELVERAFCENKRPSKEAMLEALTLGEGEG